MWRHPVHPVGAWLAALLCLLSLTPGRALADTASPTPRHQAQCLAAGGVWVVVDLPDEVLAAGCATNPTSGSDALRQVGVQISTTDKGLVCELQGRPQRFCSAHQGYDKATKQYWSYWHRSAPDQPWAYSKLGADSYHPQPGSIEGWAFGAASVTPRDQTAPVTPPPLPPSSKAPWGLVVTGVLVVVALLWLLWWRRRRPRRDEEE